MLDHFLRIDGIPGESTDNQFQGEIELLSWKWGVRFNPTTDTDAPALPPLNMSAFEGVKHIDRASPKLMLACASRRVIPRAILSCRKAGGPQPIVLRLTFSDIRVVSYQVQSGSDDLPVLEEFGLRFDRIEFETAELRADGTAGGVFRTGWDVPADQPC